MPKAAFEQVLGPRAADRRIIDVDQGKPALRHDAQHIDRRQTNFGHGRGDLLILDASDDAVAAPVFQPPRDHFLQAPRLVIDRPRTMLMDIAGDAVEDVAAGRQRRFHDQRHARPASCCRIGTRIGHVQFL